MWRGNILQSATRVWWDELVAARLEVPAGCKVARVWPVQVNA
jgi:hypothetical protein